jgi:hypothetical protein
MKFSVKVFLVILVAFSCFESFESQPLSRLLSKLRSKKPGVRRLSYRSSGYRSTLERINSILKAEAKDFEVKHVRNTPIFKRGAVYKIQVDAAKIGNSITEHYRCYARIDLEFLSVFDCWNHRAKQII